MKTTFSLLLLLALTHTATAGLITDPLSAAPAAVSPTPPPSPPAAPMPVIDFTAARQQLSDLIGRQPEGVPLPIAHLMRNPLLAAALHAKGPQADELRGYMDWLMLTGIVVGQEEIFGGGGDDEVVAEVTPSDDGFVFGTTTYISGPSQPPVNGFVFGTTSYDSAVPQAPQNGFIYGQPIYFLTGAPKEGFLFGQTVYLAGDSQDHNPDLVED